MKRLLLSLMWAFGTPTESATINPCRLEDTSVSHRATSATTLSGIVGRVDDVDVGLVPQPVDRLDPRVQKVGQQPHPVPLDWCLGQYHVSEQAGVTKGHPVPVVVQSISGPGAP